MKVVAANLIEALKGGGISGSAGKPQPVGSIAQRPLPPRGCKSLRGHPRPGEVSGNGVRGPQGMRLPEGKGYRT
jgi:hypothetical protein